MLRFHRFDEQRSWYRRAGRGMSVPVVVGISPGGDGGGLQGMSTPRAQHLLSGKGVHPVPPIPMRGAPRACACRRVCASSARATQQARGQSDGVIKHSSGLHRPRTLAEPRMRGNATGRTIPDPHILAALAAPPPPLAPRGVVGAARQQGNQTRTPGSSGHPPWTPPHPTWLREPAGGQAGGSTRKARGIVRQAAHRAYGLME